MKNRSTLTSPIPRGKIPHLLSSIEDRRDKIAIACGIFFGMRPSEILNLKWRDLVGKEKISYYQSKQNRYREVWMTEEAKKIIEECYIGQNIDLHIFPSKIKRGEHISGRQFRTRVKSALKKAEIKLLKNDSPHCLRKTWARTFYDANTRSGDPVDVLQSLELLRKSLGHSNINITMKYIGLIDERIKEASLNVIYSI